MQYRRVFPVLTAVIGVATAAAVTASPAKAEPYAYASNQISGLTINYADGSSLTNITSATTNVSDSALYGSGPGSTNHADGLVGNALTISQAYSGPGPSPASTYSPVGAGNFVGTRANAAIGAGNAASGGVTVDNVAEGYGTLLGNSTGTNSATISFTVVGTGQQVHLMGTDAYALMATSAANPLETATASIANSFSVTAAGDTSPLATYSPLSKQVSSLYGTPPNNSESGTFAFNFLTPILADGVTYNISLSSSASENINPGTAVPEPASLAVLGVALFGFGCVRRRRA